MGRSSQLASDRCCPGSSPGGNPDRSCAYPGQTAYLEGNSGADGVAKPVEPLEAPQGSEQKGVSWHKIAMSTIGAINGLRAPLAAEVRAAAEAGAMSHSAH